MNYLKIFLILFASIANAGNNTLPVETGRVIQRQHINKFQTALAGNLLPRDPSGVVTDLAGNIGEPALRWDTATVKKLKLLQDVSGNGISLVSPSALTSAYTWTLPDALPASSQNLRVSSAGVISYSDTPVASASSGVFTYSAGSTVAITNLNVTLTTKGRPVLVAMVGTGDLSNTTRLHVDTTQDIYIVFDRDGTTLSAHKVQTGTGGTLDTAVTPVQIDFVSAGSHTYTMKVNSNNPSFSLANFRLVAVEL